MLITSFREKGDDYYRGLYPTREQREGMSGFCHINKELVNFSAKARQIPIFRKGKTKLFDSLHLEAI
jgi:hypothetical protein